MSVPKVSVCVVTYNHARYIRDCLMSVLAQAEDVPLEILIGDDLSEDETSEIIKTLADNHPGAIRYFRHAERKGPAGNYQFLINKARGEYIAHLDGDDFWLPGKLRKQISYFDESPQVIAIYSNAIIVDERGSLRGGFNKQIPRSFDTGFLLRKGNFLCHSSLIYHSKIRNYILTMTPPFLDYQIHLALAQQGTLGYVNSTLVGYRVSSISSITVLNIDYVRSNYWKALVNIKKSPHLNQDIGSAMTQFFFISSWDLAAAHQFKSIYQIWKNVIANIPISRFRFLYLLLQFFIEHLFFKFGNFFCNKVLGRPLKIYFNR